MCLQCVRVSRLSRRVDGELQAADCRRSQSCVSAWSCFQGNERRIACFLLLYFFSVFSFSFPSPCLSLFFVSVVLFSKVRLKQQEQQRRATNDRSYVSRTHGLQPPGGGKQLCLRSNVHLQILPECLLFCHSLLFIWQPALHWDTHLWFRGNGWFCAVGRCERGKQLCLRLSGSSTQRTGSGQPTNQPTDRPTQKNRRKQRTPANQQTGNNAITDGSWHLK